MHRKTRNAISAKHSQREFEINVRAEIIGDFIIGPVIHTKINRGSVCASSAKYFARIVRRFTFVKTSANY